MNYVMVNALQNVFAWHEGIGRYLSLPIVNGELQTNAVSQSGIRPDFKMFPITEKLLSSLSEEEAFWAGVGLSMELQLMVARQFPGSSRTENP